MIDYTSLDVSRRLEKAGFKADIDGWHTDESGMDTMPTRDTPLPPIDADGIPIMTHYPAYRSDVLLAWLLRRGGIGYVMSVSPGTITVSYNVFDISAGPFVRKAETLPDALAEMVMKVREVLQ